MIKGKVLRKASGIVLISLPFVASFVVGCIEMGVLYTLAAFAITSAIVAVVCAGLFLLME